MPTIPRSNTSRPLQRPPHNTLIDYDDNDYSSWSPAESVDLGDFEPDADEMPASSTQTQPTKSSSSSSSTSKMGDATVNGDFPKSSFLDHLTSYPLIADSMSTFKSNSYGAKAIDYTNLGYSKLVKPNLYLLEKPASYAKPYVVKVDSLGDSILTKVDEKIPVLKSETAEIKGTIFDYAHWPLTKAGETKEWVFSTYNKEYKKCGGDGYVAGGKAVITGSLVLSSETINWFASLLSSKKEEAENVVREKTSN